MHEISKISEKRLAQKRRDAQIGFANNAFGAAAGAYGAKAVYNEQMKRHYPDKWAAKQAAKEAKHKVHPPNAISRAVQRVPKLPAKYAVPAGVGAAIGSQVLNAGMDAQSAKYFGEELKEMRGTVKKNDQSFTDAVVLPPRVDGVGRNLNTVAVSKADGRKRTGGEKAAYAGMITGAAGAATGFGGLQIADRRADRLMPPMSYRYMAHKINVDAKATAMRPNLIQAAELKAGVPAMDGESMAIKRILEGKHLASRDRGTVSHAADRARLKELAVKRSTAQARAREIADRGALDYQARAMKPAAKWYLHKVGQAYKFHKPLKRLGAGGAGLAGVSAVGAGALAFKHRNDKVSKAKRRFDAEGDRQRRLGMYEGAGAVGMVGLGTASAKVGAHRYAKWHKGLKPGEAEALKAIRGKMGLPAALAAGAAGSGALTLAAERRASSARNQRWT